eukprot:Hpha_TRINITY_DN15873_c1_g7::TRINITY_DN15873_c1_g7_i1::g.189805::m.189805
MTTRRWPVDPPPPGELPRVKAPVSLAARHAQHPPPWQAGPPAPSPLQVAVADAIASGLVPEACGAAAGPHQLRQPEAPIHAPPRPGGARAESPASASAAWARGSQDPRSLAPSLPQSLPQSEIDRRMSPKRHGSPGGAAYSAESVSQEDLKSVREHLRSECETLRRIQALQSLEEQRKLEAIEKRLKALEDGAGGIHPPLPPAPPPPSDQMEPPMGGSPGQGLAARVEELERLTTGLLARCESQDQEIERLRATAEDHASLEERHQKLNSEVRGLRTAVEGIPPPPPPSLPVSRQDSGLSALRTAEDAQVVAEALGKQLTQLKDAHETTSLQQRRMLEAERVQRQDLDTLRAQFDEVRSNLGTTKEEIREAAATAERNLSTTAARLRKEASEDNERANDERHAMRQTFEALRRDVEGTESNQERLRKEMQTNNKQTGEVFSALRSQLKDAADTASEQSSVMDTLRRHVRELHEALDKVREEQTESRGRQQETDAELVPLKQSVQQLPSDVGRLAQRVQDLESDVQDVRGVQEQLRSTIADQDQKSEGASGELARVGHQLQELSSAHDKVDRDLSELAESSARLAKSDEASREASRAEHAALRDSTERRLKEANLATEGLQVELQSVREQLSSRLDEDEQTQDRMQRVQERLQEAHERLLQKQQEHASKIHAALEHIASDVESGKNSSVDSLRADVERHIQDQQTRCDALGAQMDASLTGLSATNTALQRLNDRLNFVDEHLENIRRDRDTDERRRRATQQHPQYTQHSQYPTPPQGYSQALPPHPLSPPASASPAPPGLHGAPQDKRELSPRRTGEAPKAAASRLPPQTYSRHI